MWVLAAMVMGSAQAACSDFRLLEQDAAQARLADTQRQCLEGLRTSGGQPDDRVQASFVLVIDAYATRQLDRYESLMREHLAMAPTDAEVAFLLATHLHRNLGRSDDEVMHWARVALDGKRRWAGNRNNHDQMVKTLYDTLVEAGMERAIAAAEDGHPDVERYKREAKYWLTVAGPCLHRGDCGPYYEVEVEGYASCEDLDALESRRRPVSDEEASCLRARYRKTGSPRQRILELVVAWAEAGKDGGRWDTVRSWHWRVTEAEDPDLLLRHARWLATHGEARQAIEVAEVALADPEMFRTRALAETEKELLRLMIDQADRAQLPWKADVARVRLNSLE